MSSLFPGTHEHRFAINGVEIFARAGGSGPPLLLIHGFPQTIWTAPTEQDAYEVADSVARVCIHFIEGIRPILANLPIDSA